MARGAGEVAEDIITRGNADCAEAERRCPRARHRAPLGKRDGAARQRAHRARENTESGKLTQSVQRSRPRCGGEDGPCVQQSAAPSGRDLLAPRSRWRVLLGRPHRRGRGLEIRQDPHRAPGET